MSSKLSDFVRLSPLEAVLVVLLGRFRLPARYEEPEVMDERIEPGFDDTVAVDEAAGPGDWPLPHIADEA